MGLFNKKKKVEEFTDVTADTVNVITGQSKTVEPTKEELAEQERLTKELFGGPYSLELVGANPVVIGVIQLNLLHSIRDELRKSTALLEDLKDGLE
jgi:hypothetical protein